MAVGDRFDPTFPQPDRARIRKSYWNKALSIYDSIPQSVDERASFAAKGFSEILKG